MKYLKTKKDSLEEAISKAINEKPDSSKDLKEDVNAKDLLEKAGKYLKYSDLLLQKGRMMAKNKSTAMIDREIEKEKKRLGIKDEFDAQLQGMAEAVTEGDKEEYTKFFNAALKKFGVKSPADFKDDAKKKEFFNYIDKNFKGDHEEELDKEDKPTVKKVIDKLKKASKAHADQSMRSILADIWKMNEGKSPFEKDEGFASDAQRRAAFASGYKAKGKKGKKEEIEKSDKTMTGKKPTKVEIEPQVK